MNLQRRLILLLSRKMLSRTSPKLPLSFQHDESRVYLFSRNILKLDHILACLDGSHIEMFLTMPSRGIIPVNTREDDLSLDNGSNEKKREGA